MYICHRNVNMNHTDEMARLIHDTKNHIFYIRKFISFNAWIVEFSARIHFRRIMNFLQKAAIKISNDGLAEKQSSLTPVGTRSERFPYLTHASIIKINKTCY